MKFSIGLLATVLIANFSASEVYAQLQTPLGDYLFPSNPTSADNLILSLAGQTCGGFLPFTGNSYKVNMAQNNITVFMGEQVGIQLTCPPTPRDEVDLGRLPAGSYTLTLIGRPSGNTPGAVYFSNFPFTVTDARLAKKAPYVRLDYSGNWWDPNDSGWGLFIWHDANDSVLAAWFTYGTDGKAVWYVFQPTWQTDAATRTVNLLQTNRQPGPTAPPPGPTTSQVVGTASLDFTNFSIEAIDKGKLTYTFTGGAAVTRNIQRFKP